MKKILQRFKNEMQQRIKKKGKKYTQGWTDALAVLEVLMVAVTPATDMQVEILARVMWGERPNLCGYSEMDAAKAVGYTFLNRLDATWWGTAYADVAKGFHGYSLTETVPTRYYDLAKEIIAQDADPRPVNTLFVLSYTDLHNSNRIWLIPFAEWKYQATIDGTQYGLFGFKDDPTKARPN